jgi:hypothetical protein
VDPVVRSIWSQGASTPRRPSVWDLLPADVRESAAASAVPLPFLSAMKPKSAKKSKRGRGRTRPRSRLWSIPADVGDSVIAINWRRVGGNNVVTVTVAKPHVVSTKSRPQVTRRAARTPGRASRRGRTGHARSSPSSDGDGSDPAASWPSAPRASADGLLIRLTEYEVDAEELIAPLVRFMAARMRARRGEARP